MKVFISYSSREKEQALQLKGVLIANGFDCWMAPESIPAGSNYAEQIPKAISSCDAFVLLLSKHSQDSIYVPKEMNLALDRGKPIFPFHIDGSDMKEQFYFFLTNVQRIDAMGRTSEACEELVRNLCLVSNPPMDPPDPIITRPINDQPSLVKPPVASAERLKDPAPVRRTKLIIIMPVILAVIAAAVIVMNTRDIGGTDGTDTSAGVEASTDVEASADAEEPAGTNAQNSSGAEDSGNDTWKGRTSPEMEDLLARANKGDARAQYELGKKYYTGTDVEQDYGEAISWYTKAAEHGDTDAQYDLGEIYHNGTGTEKDDNEAIKWYRQAADNGRSSAMCKVGVILLTGEETEKDEKEAIKYFQKAADQEDPEGEYYLGLVHFTGIGTQFETVPDTDTTEAHAEQDQVTKNGIDYEKAVEWFTKAAAHDLPEAQNMLGNCMKAGIGTDQNFEEAFSWYKKAAAQGLPEAQFNLAETYAAGRGVDQSDELAAEWYTKAAEQGLAKAQTNLGILYAQGKGVPKNEEEAFNWFQKAAEQGDPAGQLNLAYMYLTGTGTGQDYEKAFELLVKAAENEEADPEIIGTAALTLVELYSESSDIDYQKDKDEAARWLEIAEEQGDKESERLMGIFDEKSLTSSEPQYHEDNYSYVRCSVCGRLFKTTASPEPSDDYPEVDSPYYFVPDPEGWPYCSDECAIADGWEYIGDGEWEQVKEETIKKADR